MSSAPDNTGETELVDVRRQDDLDLPRANFWKIDVEGSQLELLEGARTTLLERPPALIQIEIFGFDKRRYIQTLNFLRNHFKFVWALGVSNSGKISHFEINTKNISSLEFHQSLARVGTPLYFASECHLRDWTDQ